MCRLLAVRSENEFEITSHLTIFAELCKNSKEFQGHGWGCVFIEDGRWKIYKNIIPIWEDNLEQFGKATLLIAHARSAFQDKGIVVENNMPFYDENYIYISNLELRGVRIKEQGRIGAEKVFNFIRRFYKGIMEDALEKAVEQIKKRSRYVKALNIIIADWDNIFVACNFNEQPEYFQMYYKEGDELVICSDPYPGEEWEKVKNGTIEVF